MSAAVLKVAVVVAAKPKPQLATMTEPSLGGTAMKMVLVLGVLAAIAWYLRRRAAGGRSRPVSTVRSLRRGARPGAAPRSALRVVARQTLGKGACLAVVEWEGREVLVGVTNAGISFYNEASAAAFMATAEPDPATDAAPGDAPVRLPATDPALRLAASRAYDVTTDAPRDARPTVEGAAVRPTFLVALRDLTVRR